MKFGPAPLEKVAGAFLAHATVAGERRLRKGQRLTVDDVDALRAAGILHPVVAILDANDLGEDEAASRIAASLRTRDVEVKPAATGRVNLHAAASGVFTVDRGLVDAVNAVDPAVTLATLPEFAPVTAGQMVATVKIIPFAVEASTIERVEALCEASEMFAVNRYEKRTFWIVQTTLPGIKPSVLDKTVRITRDRLARSGSIIAGESRVPHEQQALIAAVHDAAARAEAVLVFGASAVSDGADVVPAAIRAAGGRIERIGMPVDPGNLLVLAWVGDVPVLGAPGCARSPKENGFDWVLDRILAGVPPTGTDIARMGVGGLLMEIPTRPQPREKPARSLKVYGLLLAAGRSSRMGGPNKLMADFDGQPLVRRSASRLLSSRAAGAVAVLGHQASRVEDALSGLRLSLVRNPDFPSGLSGSLKAGISALPDDAAGALVMLADMPAVAAGDLDAMISAFMGAEGQAIVRASHAGKRGNPVILPRALFPAVAELEGDTGARHIVESGAADVIDVEIGEGAFVDVDTPDAMRAAGGVLQD